MTDSATRESDMDAFIELLGIRFNDPDIIIQALTHPSYVNEHQRKQPDLQHNERLEFLGDAVLEFIAGGWLYAQFPHEREGQLTRLRSALTRTDMLAEFGLMLGVDSAMRLGKAEEKNLGRTRRSTICNTFEAIVCAIYIDLGETATRDFLMPFFKPALDRILKRVSTKDNKSRLQEYIMRQPDHLTPDYHVLASLGPEHAVVWVVEVRLSGECIGWGSGTSKRKAEQAAAGQAITVIIPPGAEEN